MTREEKINKIISIFQNVLEESMVNLVAGEGDLPKPVQTLVIAASKRAVTEGIREEYEKAYTDEDLDVLLAFYDTETGRKGIELSKTMTSARFQEKIVAKTARFIESLFNEQN